jgi:hypothetical protein
VRGSDINADPSGWHPGKFFKAYGSGAVALGMFAAGKGVAGTHGPSVAAAPANAYRRLKGCLFQHVRRGSGDWLSEGTSRNQGQHKAACFKLDMPRREKHGRGAIKGLLENRTEGALNEVRAFGVEAFAPGSQAREDSA